MATQAPTPVPGQDLSSDFDADWKQAQQRVQAATSSGLSQQDAEKLYLAPVTTKWNIIQSNPSAFTTKSNLDKINSDFETAQESAVKNLSRSDSTEKTVSDQLSPLAQKWSIASQFPTEPKIPTTETQINASNAKNPALTREEDEALSQIEKGQPESQAILNHPILLKVQPFASRWNPRLNAAIARDAREKDKTSEASSPEKLEPTLKFRNWLSNQIDTNTNLPPTMKSVLGSKISDIDASLTNGVQSPFSAKPQFQPPADESTNQPAQPQAAQPPQPPTPTSKAEFDSIPSGALYVNPADGNTYRKK